MMKNFKLGTSKFLDTEKEIDLNKVGDILKDKKFFSPFIENERMLSSYTYGGDDRCTICCDADETEAMYARDFNKFLADQKPSFKVLPISRDLPPVVKVTCDKFEVQCPGNVDRLFYFNPGSLTNQFCYLDEGAANVVVLMDFKSKLLKPEMYTSYKVIYSKIKVIQTSAGVAQDAQMGAIIDACVPYNNIGFQQLYDLELIDESICPKLLAMAGKMGITVGTSYPPWQKTLYFDKVGNIKVCDDDFHDNPPGTTFYNGYTTVATPLTSEIGQSLTVPAAKMITPEVSCVVALDEFPVFTSEPQLRPTVIKINKCSYTTTIMFMVEVGFQVEPSKAFATDIPSGVYPKMDMHRMYTYAEHLGPVIGVGGELILGNSCYMGHNHPKFRFKELKPYYDDLYKNYKIKKELYYKDSLKEKERQNNPNLTEPLYEDKTGFSSEKYPLGPNGNLCEPLYPNKIGYASEKQPPQPEYLGNVGEQEIQVDTKVNQNREQEIPNFLNRAITQTGRNVALPYSGLHSNRLFRDFIEPLSTFNYAYFPYINEEGEAEVGIVVVSQESLGQNTYTTYQIGSPLIREYGKEEPSAKKVVNMHVCNTCFQNTKTAATCMYTVVSALIKQTAKYIPDEFYVTVFANYKIAQTSWSYAFLACLTMGPSGGFYTGVIGTDKDNNFTIREPGDLDKKIKLANERCPLHVLLPPTVDDTSVTGAIYCSGVLPKMPPNLKNCLTAYGFVQGILLSMATLGARGIKDTPVSFFRSGAQVAYSKIATSPPNIYIYMSVVKDKKGNKIIEQAAGDKVDKITLEDGAIRLSMPAKYQTVFTRGKKYFSIDDIRSIKGEDVFKNVDKFDYRGKTYYRNDMLNNAIGSLNKDMGKIRDEKLKSTLENDQAILSKITMDEVKKLAKKIVQNLNDEAMEKEKEERKKEEDEMEDQENQLGLKLRSKKNKKLRMDSQIPEYIKVFNQRLKEDFEELLKGYRDIYQTGKKYYTPDLNERGAEIWKDLGFPDKIGKEGKPSMGELMENVSSLGRKYVDPVFKEFKITYNKDEDDRLKKLADMVTTYIDEKMEKMENEDRTSFIDPKILRKKDKGKKVEKKIKKSLNEDEGSADNENADQILYSGI